MIIFNLQSRQPIKVRVNGKVYDFPRFKRRDWREWQIELDAERQESASQNLSPEERARLLLLYPLEPLTKSNMRARLDTLEGSGRVFGVCAAKAGVPEAEIKAIVEDGEIDEIDLETVVLMLASLADPAEVAKRLGMSAEEDDAGDEREDLKSPLDGSACAPKN